MTQATLGLGRFSYTRGLHDLGRGLYAYLQPDGSWGWSNAGLVVDGERSLLVDTLFDLPLTREMLAAMRAAEPRAAAAIDVVVNTHANGDHCHGNQLLAGAEIIASRAAAKEMSELPPEALANLLEAFSKDESRVARFARKAFGPFQFRGIEHVAPTRTFDGALTLHVGAKRVELIEVGPAHTRGDVLVYLPAERVIFSGDILFIEGTPIVWAGPVSNWIAACDRMLAMDLEVVVPGHGPITDLRGVAAVKAYLTHVYAETKARFAAGMSAWDAARDIPLGAFADWSDAERIAVNVDTIYRELAGAKGAPTPTMELFGRMAELARL